MTKPEDILVVGDSYANACVSTPTSVPSGGWIPNAGWPLLLGIPEANRQGVPGATAEEWANDFEGRLSRAKATQAEVCIIALCGNDVWNFAHTSGCVDLWLLELARMNGWYRAVVASVRKPRTIAFLYTDPYFGKDVAAADALSGLNAFILSESETLGIEIFDTRTVLKPEHFNGVDIHPNEAGQEAIAAGLRAMLEMELAP